ncbi:hypothetical protein [Streptomyces griseorubiginosus]|uniref:hypothetical protein n=1 Tax=Streptomyces griseorubiginosus TaxID=67304 RepID=UPI0036E4A561
MNGASGLWQLWQALSVALADGRSHEQLMDMAPNPAVRTAMAMLMKQLSEHGMLVEVPTGWGDPLDPASPPARIASWLASVAAEPVTAWERIRSAAVSVGGTGPVATAGARALTGAGVKVLQQDGHGSQAATPVVFSAAEVSVAAAVAGDVGFVTPAGTSVAAHRDAEVISRRIGLPGGLPSPTALAALVGGAAAHRLVCAIAGLPDPGEDTLAASPSAEPSTLGHPTVLVARLDPLSAEYHPWLDSGKLNSSIDEPADLDTVLTLVEALSDPETGVLPVLAVDDLPQLPAGLVHCRVGDDVVCGIGNNTAMARLSCAMGAAEHLTARYHGFPTVVGASSRHAEGVRLRRLVHVHHPCLEGTETGDWALSPHARRWLKAVTLRFGIRADLRVQQLASGVYHAEMHCEDGVLGWAVENTAADAAAFCALAAAGTLQWQAVGGDPMAMMYAPCGAAPPPTMGASDSVPWQTDSWIWPAPASKREDTLQDELRRLLGALAPSATSLARNPGRLRALAVAGFVTLEVSP